MSLEDKVNKLLGDSVDEPVYKKTMTSLRRAYLKASKELRKTYITVNELRPYLADLLDGELTDSRFVKLLINNESVYDVNAEIAQKKSEGSLRYRNRNIGVLVITPKRPPAIEGDKIFV
jgi:hypothetical protein